jgi:hypothetical protein
MPEILTTLKVKGGGLQSETAPSKNLKSYLKKTLRTMGHDLSGRALPLLQAPKPQKKDG